MQQGLISYPSTNRPSQGGQPCSDSSHELNNAQQDKS